MLLQLAHIHFINVSWKSFSFFLLSFSFPDSYFETHNIGIHVDNSSSKRAWRKSSIFKWPILPRISYWHGWSAVPPPYPSTTCIWSYGTDQGYDNTGLFPAKCLFLSMRNLLDNCNLWFVEKELFMEECITKLLLRVVKRKMQIKPPLL